VGAPAPSRAENKIFRRNLGLREKMQVHPQAEQDVNFRTFLLNAGYLEGRNSSLSSLFSPCFEGDD